ncbi:MAG TPA: hypothetical protein VIX17_27760 [Pyrinomonadaceae bacterium]
MLRVQADPLVFANVVALQNGGSTSVDLFSNPGTTLLGPQISFRIDVTGTLPPGATDTLVVTYTEQGVAPITQSFGIPFGNVSPPLSFLVTFVSPTANFQGVPVTLTVSLLNSNPDFVIPSGQNGGAHVDGFTYSFNVAQPVPEPVSFLLLGSSLVAVGIKRFGFRDED